MHYRHTFLAFRQLLARLRDVMAGDEDPQTRLSRIVGIIAEDMGAEVCSIYVRRAGEVLELFATRGLRESAIHVTRLRYGEGLIGEIAATGRPLALADAQHHPSFVYRPETGEEIYQSFLGVPILGGGRAIGVLAVQNVDWRRYTDEEIEVLQTVAMVLAELVASGELVSRQELSPTEGIVVRPLRLEGVGLNSGIGIGLAILHRRRIVVRNFVADNIAAEHERLRKAVADMHGSLDGLLDDPDGPLERDYRDVVETYRMIAADAGWLGRIGDAINAGLTAEAAVQKVSNEIRARMSQIADPYLKERTYDLEDLANRLLQHLLGPDDLGAHLPAGSDIILVARSMGPSDLLNYERRCVRGLVLEEGTSTSHVCIVARALDIPVVGQVRDALIRIENGDHVIVDADHAQVFVRPGENLRQAYLTNLEMRNKRKASYAADRDVRAITRDGVAITINMNAGLLVDLPHLAMFGADGVGLYRTEVPFLVRSSLPDVDTQQRLYRRVLEYADGKPVTFRTLDIGGDKVLRCWEHVVEENPAMGWRAIRVAEDHPAILRQQLRAMIRAAAGRELAVMFPMVAHVQEFIRGRDLLDRELERERLRGAEVPKSVRVGAMLEVPSLVLQLDSLLKQVDFLSVGTNDLRQFFFAADRGSTRMANRYDVLSPVFLRLLADIARHCRSAGVPLSLCGEMAAEPLEALALIGIGYRSLSLPPFAVGPIKTMIRSVRLSTLEDYITVLSGSAESSVRCKLRAFAHDHAVVL
jgi:phosphotransferase system enzyme I (PtsP)